MAYWPATAFTSDQVNIPTSDGDIIEFTGAFSEWDIFRGPESGVGGRICYGSDVSIIQEMMDAVEEEHNKELDRKIRIIGEALDALNNFSEFKGARWFGRGDSWTRTYPGPNNDPEWPKYRTWAHLMLWPLEGEIPEALDQAEEDFDYEKSLYEENKACEKQQINLHRLLAQDPNARPHRAGQASSEYGDVRLESHNPYQTDRFTLDVEMITNFPDGKQGGYALGKTPYGLVYFPSKFRGFVEKAYYDDHGTLYHTGWYSVTVALRDAASRENDRVKSVFTAVYSHGDLE